MTRTFNLGDLFDIYKHFKNRKGITTIPYELGNSQHSFQLWNEKEYTGILILIPTHAAFNVFCYCQLHGSPTNYRIKEIKYFTQKYFLLNEIYQRFNLT